MERFRDMIDDICRVANVSMSLVDTKYQTLYLYEKESDPFCRKIQSPKAGETACHHSVLDMLKRCAEQRRPVFHLCHAGKAVAATIMRLMEQPELMEKAKAEHKAKVGADTFVLYPMV